MRLRTSSDPHHSFTAMEQNRCTESFLQTTLLHSLVNVSQFGYKYFSYSYTAVTTKDTITFAFDREKFSAWYLDDISIVEKATNAELIENGNFENGTLFAFRLCRQELSAPRSYLKSRSAHSGQYSFAINSSLSIDYLSQTFSTRVGQLYNISYWLQNSGKNGQENRMRVIMSAASFHELKSVALFLLCFSFLFFVLT